MKTALFRAVALLAAAAGLASCGNDVTCGPNTRLDKPTNQCVYDPPPDLNVIVDDFQIGKFKMTQVDVPEQLQVGSPQTRSFTITNVGSDDRDVVMVRYAVAPVKETIQELRDAIDEMSDGSELGATFIGMVTIKDLKAGETRTVQYYLSAPESLKDGLYGFMFAVDEVPLTESADGDVAIDYSKGNVAKSEGEARLGSAAMIYAPATVIIGKPDKPNLRVLFAKSDNAAFELDDSERAAAAMFTVSARMSAQGLDVTEPISAVFKLKLPGHSPKVPGQDLGPAWFLAKGLDYAAAPATTEWVYDKDRSFSLLIQRTDGRAESVEYESSCRTETVLPEAGPDGGEPTPIDVQRCATLYNEEGLDDVYQLHLRGEDIQLLGLTRTLPAHNPDLDQDGEIAGWLRYELATSQAEYQGNLADNTLAIPVVFMAPDPGRAATLDDKDNNGVSGSTSPAAAVSPMAYPVTDNTASASSGNEWLGAGYRFENEAAVDKAVGVPIGSLQESEAKVTGNIFKNDVNLLVLSGGVGWHQQDPMDDWFADASLGVFGYNILDAQWDPSYCVTENKVTYCPLFEREPKAKPTEEAQRLQNGAAKKPRKTTRALNIKWDIPLPPIGPVPTILSIEIGVLAGIHLGGNIIIDSTSQVPKYGVEIYVGPWANLGCAVFAGANLGLARVGVEGEVSLIGVELVPTLRLVARLDHLPTAPCWNYADATLLFEGPLTFSGPSGSVSLVVYLGTRISFLNLTFETKILTFTFAKFSTFSKTWKLWTLSTGWGAKPSDPGMCPGALPPAVADVWRSPTECGGKYCNSSSTGTPSVRVPSSVLANYKKTYSLIGTIANCADVKVTGTTETVNDVVVIYDVAGKVQNEEAFVKDGKSVKVPGWSGAIDKTVRVCSPLITAALETNATNTREGVTVTFTPVQ